MILLLGGTSDAAPLAQLLAEAGYEVLVSKATYNPLASGNHPRIRLRQGPLDKEGLERLVEKESIRAIVNAAHPYARSIRQTSREVADRLGLAHLSFIRPPELLEAQDAVFAPDHEQAARIAFSFNRPVLLTTGSRNLAPYAKAAKKSGILLAVRVLNDPQSIDACLAAGVLPDRIIAARGPFGLQENLDVIDQFSIGVLVTKDGGKPSGASEKIEAARIRNCRAVVVSRPDASDEPHFQTFADLLSELLTQASPKSRIIARP